MRLFCFYITTKHFSSRAVMEWAVHTDFTEMATSLYNCDLFFSCLLATLGLCLEEQQATISEELAVHSETRSSDGCCWL